MLRRAQRRHPDDVWINYDLARALEKLARRPEATRYHTAARALRPETAHELAHALQQQGEGDEAIAVLEDLRRLRPSNGRHLACLAKALKARGRSKEAAPILEEAVAAERAAVAARPDDVSAHHNLGLALEHQGKLEEAIAEYRAALRIQPGLATAYNNIGWILDGQGKLKEAMVEFRAELRIRPDDAPAHNSFAWYLVIRADLALAAEALEHAAQGRGPGAEERRLAEHAGPGRVPRRPLCRVDRRGRAVNRTDAAGRGRQQLVLPGDGLRPAGRGRPGPGRLRAGRRLDAQERPEEPRADPVLREAAALLGRPGPDADGPARGPNLPADVFTP